MFLLFLRNVLVHARSITPHKVNICLLVSCIDGTFIDCGINSALTERFVITGNFYVSMSFPGLVIEGAVLYIYC